MPPPQPSSVNPLTLVFHIDILLASIFASFVVWTLPRAAARFTQAVEWTHGHTLRFVRLDPRRRKRTAGCRAAMASEKWRELQSDDSHTLISHAYLGQRRAGRDVRTSFPPHVSAWPIALRPLAPVARYRIIPAFSVGQLLILAGYFGIIAYASSFDANPLTDSARMGAVSMSQVPIVFALATKNNLVGMLLGKGYEKLNFLHRFVGWIAVVTADLHSLAIIYAWLSAGTFTKQIKAPSHIWGLVALICVNAIVIFSADIWRRKAYNVFLTTHITSFSLLLPALYYHQPNTLYYVLAAVGFYALDHLMRIFKTRLTSARLRPIPELGLTRIEMPYLNAGWRAGQHVRIRVLSAGMGWYGWAEAHPFSIANVSESPEGMVLMCKKTGRWTQKLYQLGTVAGYQSDEGEGKRARVLVEGPYGGHGHMVFTSYSSALFVVGGSGITFALSSIEELVRRDNDAASRLKSIDLVWSVQDPGKSSSLAPLIPAFNALIQQSAHTPLRISVFYTRATAAPPSEKEHYGHPCLTLSAGRPRIGKALEGVLSKAVGLTKGPKDAGALMGVIVAVCGPAGLGDDVVKAVGAVDGARRDAVGGIEIFEEFFQM